MSETGDEKRTSLDVLIDTIGAFNAGSVKIEARLEAIEKAQDLATPILARVEARLDAEAALKEEAKKEADAARDAEAAARAEALRLAEAAQNDKKDRWQTIVKIGQEALKLAPVQMLLTGLVMWILLRLGVANLVGIGGGQ